MKKMMIAVVAFCSACVSAQNSVVTNGTAWLDDLDSSSRVVVDAFENASNRVDALINEKIPTVMTTNDVENIVTNEIEAGFSEWSFSAHDSYAPAVNLKAVHSMEWIETGSVEDCVFPSWRCEATVAVIGPNGNWIERTNVYYSGFFGYAKPVDVTSVNLALDMAADSWLTATRKRIIRNSLGLARLSDLTDLATTNFVAAELQKANIPNVSAPTVTNIATAVVESKISPDDSAFSNAVLSVGIGVDTNAVAAINAILDGEDDALPVGGATTVGGLLAALAAALAALKKKVIEKYPFIASAVAGDTLTLAPFSRNALTSDGTAFTVLMGGTDGYLRDCVFVVTAGETAPNISWGVVGGVQKFSPRTDAATDMEIAAGVTKVFWVSEYAEDKFVVAGWEVPSVSE